MENNNLEQEDSVDLLSIQDDDEIEIEPPDLDPDPAIPIYPDNNDTENNYSYYESTWEGQQIDDAIGVILGGEIEGAKDAAMQAAQAAATSAQSASQSAQAAQDASVKTPYIGNDGNWMVYNAETKSYQNSNINATGPQGQEGPPGPQGPQGPKGEKGEDGVTVNLGPGIVGFEINEEGHLIVYSDDGT